MDRHCLLLLGAAITLTACDQDAGSQPPAWFGEAEITWLADGGPPVQSPPMTAIERAILPHLGDCPQGWGRVQPSPLPVQVCEPWPEGRQACADYQVHRPGTSGCADFGSACPEDGWPVGLASEGVAFVRPGGTGDGSRDDPYGTIAEALAGRASVIALAAGEHQAGLTMDRPVSLIGACPSQTHLTYDGLCEGRAVLQSTADVTVRDVSFTGSDCSGLVVNSGTATVRDVAVLDGGIHGISATGGTIELEGLLTRRLGGYGLAALGPVTVRAHDVTIMESNAAGIVVAYEGDATVTDAVVLDPIPDAGEGFKGYGAVAYSARLELQRPVLEGTTGYAVLASGGTAVVEDAVVRDTRSLGGPGPIAVAGFNGSTLEVRRLWSDGAAGLGASESSGLIEDVLATNAPVLTSSETGSVTADRVATWGRDGLASTAGSDEVRNFTCGAYCFTVRPTGRLTVGEGELGDTRVVVAEGSTVVLEDLTYSMPSATLESAAEVTLRRVRALQPLSLRGVATLEDVWIDVSGPHAGPILHHEGSSLTASRLRIDSPNPWLIRLDTDIATLQDVSLTGGGLYVVDGETTVERMLVRGAGETGAANELGSTMALTDVALLEPDPDRCADCQSSGVHVGGTATLTRVLVEGGEPGLLVSRGRVTCEDVKAAGDTVMQLSGRIFGERCELELADSSGWLAPVGLQQD